MIDNSIILRATRDRSVMLRHPWIFSGSIERVVGNPTNGESVLVKNSRGEALGWAAFSAQSKIQCRMWNFEPEMTVDTEYFRAKIRKAIHARKDMFEDEVNTAFRLIHAESDGLPGFVVDRYTDWLVVQFLSAGAEYWRETLLNILVEESGINQVYERSDADVRQLEGLPSRKGLVRGKQAPELVEIREGGYAFLVDVVNGHKTGFYLDQRVNRKIFGECVQGKRVLNCFCYTGGFTVYALAGGAESVLSVDSSSEALALGEKNVAVNQHSAERAAWVEGDVFNLLRLYRDQAQQFDVIVLDPPKFAPTAAQAERAARGYKDINLLAMKLLVEGGLLFTFSCSGGVSAELFQKITAGAALDAKIDAQIVGYLHQGADHPVALNFPEGEYLKGLVIRKQ